MGGRIEGPWIEILLYRQLFIVTSQLLLIFLSLFSAIIFLGIGIGISIIAFICEKIFVNNFWQTFFFTRNAINDKTG